MKINEWNNLAREHLVGCEIIDAKWQTPSRADTEYGWTEQGMELILKKDGKYYALLAMKDDEGNGPGALMFTSFETEIINEEKRLKTEEIFPVQWD